MATLGVLPDHARRFAMRLVVVATIGMPLAGCWPARLTDRPKVVGAVISATDGTPIAGASVAVQAGVLGEPAFEVITDRRGVFEIEPLHSWELFTIFGENFPMQGNVAVDARGFAPGFKEISWSRTGARPLVVGVIELTESSR